MDAAKRASVWSRHWALPRRFLAHRSPSAPQYRRNAALARAQLQPPGSGEGDSCSLANHRGKTGVTQSFFHGG
jgi:hypothetical protein